MALTDLQKMVVGMLYPSQPAANASIYDLARADAQNQALGNLGAGLIGAAVPQTPLMRAQALQNAFSSMGNMGTNVYNAAQSRLMAQKAESEAGRASALSNFFNQSPASQANVAVPAQVPTSDFREIPAAARIMQPQPPTANFPGGLNAQQWGAVQQAGSLDPDEGIKLYSALVKKNAGASEGGFEGSKSLVGVFDSGGNFFQTYVDINGNIVRPPGATGNVRFATPQEINAQKASGTVEGKTSAEAKATAPDAVVSVDSAINLIDSLLSDRAALASVTGEFQGNISDPSLAYLASGTNPKATGTVAKIEQLQAKAFLAAIPSIKGTGALSDAEGSRLDAAEARLKRTQGDEAFAASLEEYRDILNRVRERQALIASGVPKSEALVRIPESPFVSGATGTQPEQGNAGNIPAGIDPEDWNFLSPEEKKLWQ